MTAAFTAPAGSAGLTAAEREALLKKVRRFATLMDSSLRIPMTGVTFGLESAIGLVPVVGDFAGGLLSCYVPFQAYRAGVPPRVIYRMLFNILLEAVVGSVPVLGDAFDVAFKANVRNVRLLETHLEAA